MTLFQISLHVCRINTTKHTKDHIRHEIYKLARRARQSFSNKLIIERRICLSYCNSDVFPSRPWSVGAQNLPLHDPGVSSPAVESAVYRSSHVRGIPGNFYKLNCRHLSYQPLAVERQLIMYSVRPVCLSLFM